MPEQYFQHELPNGMTLLAERLPGVRSAAMSLMLPCGAASDPAGSLGAANVLSDLVLRGAGDRDSRQLCEYLDGLGLQRGSGAGARFTRFSAAALAENVFESLPAYADVLRRPHLTAEGFEAVRDLCLQSLESLEDDPRSKAMLKLRECFWPEPLGRSQYGRREDLESMTPDAVRAEFARRYVPDGTLLVVAGDVNFDALQAQAEALFGDWTAVERERIDIGEPGGRYAFIEQQTEQTHIGLAYPTVPETDPDYYVVRLAVEVLGGGMSGRLFTEVREKRALCYSVSANYSATNGPWVGGRSDAFGGVLCYAGTSNERAQQTLDQVAIEVRRLYDGVTADELERARTGLKASTVMSGESTSNRSGSLAHDWIARRRLRGLDEITQSIDAVTLEQVNDYLARTRPEAFTLVVLGPKELARPS